MSKRNAIAIRSFIITSFIIFCAIIAIVLMGYCFSVMEGNIYSQNIKLFDIRNGDTVLLFEHEIPLPIKQVKSIGKLVVSKFPVGTIKLLGIVKNTSEELVSRNLLKFFLS